MGNKINPFYYTGIQMEMFTNALFGSVRSTIINGEPWFVGVDVAACLGYKNSRDALIKHVFPKNKMDGSRDLLLPSIPVTDSMGRLQHVTPVWINEAGLYQLIFTSKLQAAATFQDWVTSEVLPTMRKIGFGRSMELLERELYKVQQENEKLKLGIHNTERSYNHLMKDYQKLMENHNICVSELVELRERNEDLEISNADLNNRYYEVTKDNDCLIAQVEGRDAFIDSMYSELEIARKINGTSKPSMFLKDFEGGLR